MNSLRMAIRNVLRQRRRALLLGGAIAIGFFVMTFMEGLTAGMRASLRANIESGSVGELAVAGSEWRKDGEPLRLIREDSRLRESLGTLPLEIERLVPSSQAEASLVFNGRSARTGLIGIACEGGSSALGDLEIKEGSLADMSRPDGIVISDSVAGRLGVRAGETMLVKASTVTGQANLLELYVAAVSAGLGEGDLFQSSYAHLAAVNGLINLPEGAYQKLNLYLKGEPDLEAAAGSILAALEQRGEAVEKRESDSESPLPGGSAGPLSALFGDSEPEKPWKGTRYSVSTLDDAAGQFTAILGSLRMVSMVVFLALLSICMAGIVNTFRMILLERTREIGTMRAMGMRSREVQRLFILEAALIASGGVVMGLSAAVLIMNLLSLIPLGGGMLSLFLESGRLAFSLSPASLLLYTALVIGTSVLAAFSPARQAARLKPVEALRR